MSPFGPPTVLFLNGVDPPSAIFHHGTCDHGVFTGGVPCMGAARRGQGEPGQGGLAAEGALARKCAHHPGFGQVELSKEDLERLIESTKHDLALAGGAGGDDYEREMAESGEEDDIDEARDEEDDDDADIAEFEATEAADDAADGELEDGDDDDDDAAAAAMAVEQAAKAKKGKGKKDKKKKKKGAATPGADDDELAEYNLDDYDDEVDEGSILTGAGLNFAGLTYYKSNDDDPFITLKDEDDDEVDDFVIKPTDNLIVAGQSEEEFSHVEVYGASA